jgi:hypothetical protein
VPFVSPICAPNPTPRALPPPLHPRFPRSASCKATPPTPQFARVTAALAIHACRLPTIDRCSLSGSSTPLPMSARLLLRSHTLSLAHRAYLNFNVLDRLGLLPTIHSPASPPPLISAKLPTTSSTIASCSHVGSPNPNCQR